MGKKQQKQVEKVKATRAKKDVNTSVKKVAEKPSKQPSKPRLKKAEKTLNNDEENARLSFQSLLKMLSSQTSHLEEPSLTPKPASTIMKNVKKHIMNALGCFKNESYPYISNASMKSKSLMNTTTRERNPLSESSLLASSCEKVVFVNPANGNVNQYWLDKEKQQIPGTFKRLGDVKNFKIVNAKKTAFGENHGREFEMRTLDDGTMINNTFSWLDTDEEWALKLEKLIEEYEKNKKKENDDDEETEDIEEEETTEKKIGLTEEELDYFYNL